jgi:hypothetical protein
MLHDQLGKLLSDARKLERRFNRQKGESGFRFLTGLLSWSGS